MKAVARYTVNCSHKSFELALEAVLPKAKFHEVVWRDTENYGDDTDPDFFSTFSYPNKRCPELTKDLFWSMAVRCLATSSWHGTALFIEMHDENNACYFNDRWCKGDDRANECGPTMRYQATAFSADMAGRLKKIAELAHISGSDDE